MAALPLNQIIQGDCIEVMQHLPDASIDMIFADPPYNLQLQQELWRPNMTQVDAVDDDWDQFDTFEAYDAFTVAWLTQARRVLKENGTLWVIGSYHNIYRVGKSLMDLGFWILNDIVWIKTNPMPNFRGVRFTNAHETLLWVKKHRTGSYTFNYQQLKALNDDKQMRSDWLMPICSGQERLKFNGKKVHSTQKPEALLYRVISASSNPDDVVLDPFFGTGTTGAVAKRLHRNWIGIELDSIYIEAAKARIAAVNPLPFKETFYYFPDKRKQRRIPFGRLLEAGYLNVGQNLFFENDPEHIATIRADGKLQYRGQTGSIHQLGKSLKSAPCNGWTHWYYEQADGNRFPIDHLREQYRRLIQQDGAAAPER